METAGKSSSTPFVMIVWEPAGCGKTCDKHWAHTVLILSYVFTQTPIHRFFEFSTKSGFPEQSPLNKYLYFFLKFMPVVLLVQMNWV